MTHDKTEKSSTAGKLVIRNTPRLHLFRRSFMRERKHTLIICLAILVGIFLGGAARVLAADTTVPEWCRPLPRPEYRSIERIPVSDAWFEVYKPTAGVFAIYEPHQAEETISYLIIGGKKALLFDTGMGISDIKKVVEELTKLPVIVLNSHTHDDHVGGNWQFDTVFGMDTAFTRKNALGSREDAQAEITRDQICGSLPKNFDSKTYATRPWKITTYIRDGERIDLGGRVLEVIATPGHTPDAISLLDRANGLLFTGDTYYPAAIWLFRPETDLDAYAASIRKLAALAPQIKLVLGAHNLPVASPTVLPRLVSAFDAVRGGKIAASPESSGKVIYKVGDISFLMRFPPELH
jgi:glyoxylase-like metal-dependent hydrolase (beta-lactamase superfamily II)